MEIVGNPADAHHDLIGRSFWGFGFRIGRLEV